MGVCLIILNACKTVSGTLSRYILSLGLFRKRGVEDEVQIFHDSSGGRRLGCCAGLARSRGCSRRWRRSWRRRLRRRRLRWRPWRIWRRHGGMRGGHGRHGNARRGRHVVFAFWNGLPELRRHPRFQVLWPEFPCRRRSFREPELPQRLFGGTHVTGRQPDHEHRRNEKNCWHCREPEKYDHHEECQSAGLEQRGAGGGAHQAKCLLQ